MVRDSDAVHTKHLASELLGSLVTLLLGLHPGVRSEAGGGEFRGNFQLGKTFVFTTLHLVGAGQFVRVGPLFSGTIDLCRDQKKRRYSFEILNSCHLCIQYSS